MRQGQKTTKKERARSKRAKEAEHAQRRQVKVLKIYSRPKQITQISLSTYISENLETYFIFHNKFFYIAFEF